MYYLGLLGLFLAHRHHLGLEVQVLGIEKLNPVRKAIAIFVMKRASIVRALSNRIRDRLIKEFSIPEKNIKVVTIYVDVHKLGLDLRVLPEEEKSHFARLSADFRQKYRGKMNFLTVSRLVPVKRTYMQISALRALLPEFPNTMLHIVGDGPCEKELQRQVARLGLESHVVFHGYQKGYALGMFYVECDCFLLTSDYEGWGMVIIEAATAGLPIIMTDVGCAGELIIDGKSGIIIPPRDERALIEAMRKVLTDKEKREALSAGAINSLALLPDFDTILLQYRTNWEIALAHRL
jgi:glycosyltransferase involved in cell wall biosynthesis